MAVYYDPHQGGGFVQARVFTKSEEGIGHHPLQVQWKVVQEALQKKETGAKYYDPGAGEGSFVRARVMTEEDKLYFRLPWETVVEALKPVKRGHCLVPPLAWTEPLGSD